MKKAIVFVGIVALLVLGLAVYAYSADEPVEAEDGTCGADGTDGVCPYTCSYCKTLSKSCNGLGVCC